MADEAFASFPNGNTGETALFGPQPEDALNIPVDYQAQVNLYQAFFEVTPALDPAWFWGVVFDSLDRLPYAWKDANLPAPQRRLLRRA